MLYENLQASRRLDRGNPNPGNIGEDFNRLGLAFWSQVVAHHAGNAVRQRRLEELNEWRNAIAHQDFAGIIRRGGRAALTLARVQRWRRACDGLARSFDPVLYAHLLALSGTPPW